MTMHMVASLAPEATPTAAPARRTITGIVVPWDKPGHTSAGPVSVAQGAVTLPADLGRVKLLRDHSTEQGFTPVGYATSAEVTPDGLRMSFKVANTPDGDTALTDVAEHVRDALSVELVDTKVNAGVLTHGVLTAVALVPIPAFADARVESLTASRKDNHMTTDQTTTAPVEDDEQTTPPVVPAPDDNATAQTTTPPVEDDEDEDTTDTEDTTVDTAQTTPPAVTAARAPSGVKVHQKPALTFSQAVNTIVAMRTGEVTPDMTAALADITRSANPAISAPAWLGKLWDGVEYQREIIPTMTVKPLTKLEGVGWRWVDKPEIEDYAGDKTEIPTNTASTEAVTVKAQRMAVGHDIDRAYFDFNETEFLTEFFKARTDDYALKSDTKAGQFAAASAATGTTISAEPDLLHAAARARQTIKRQTRVEPSAYLVNPDDLFGLFDITQLDNPAYLSLLGVEPDKFIATDLVPAGAVVAYAKPALTWYELPGSPIRVDAQRLTHGGVDSAVFAYYATLLNNQRGVVRVPFGTTPAGEGA